MRFIASARSDVPALVVEVRRLKDQVAHAQADADFHDKMSTAIRKSVLEEAARVAENFELPDYREGWQEIEKGARLIAVEIRKFIDTSSGDPARQPTPAVADFASASLRRSG